MGHGSLQQKQKCSRKQAVRPLSGKEQNTVADPSGGGERRSSRRRFLLQEKSKKSRAARGYASLRAPPPLAAGSKRYKPVERNDTAIASLQDSGCMEIGQPV
jgi:hypothetical protein